MKEQRWFLINGRGIRQTVTVLPLRVSLITKAKLLSVT